MTSLQFLGATRAVTGSKFLMSAGKFQGLVECGLFQGLKELRLKNWARLPVNPASLCLASNFQYIIGREKKIELTLSHEPMARQERIHLSAIALKARIHKAADR